MKRTTGFVLHNGTAKAAIMLGTLLTTSVYLAVASCYTKNSACKDNAASGGNARKAFSDAARTTLAYIYCKSDGAYYQECNSCGSYDNVYYKESVDEECSSSDWYNAGSDGATTKYCTDNNCSSS